MASVIFVIKQFVLVYLVIHTLYGLLIIVAGCQMLVIAPTVEIFGLSSGIIIAVGVFRIFIGLATILTVGIGCYGLYRESFPFLLAISISIAITWAFEFGTLIYYLISTRDMIPEDMKISLKEKLFDNTTVGLPAIQRLFKCCGFDSYEDWKDYGYEQVPVSCCYKERITSEKTNSLCYDHYKDKPFLYPDGCYKLVNKMYRKQNDLQCIALIVIVIIKTIGVAFSFALTFLIKKRNSEET